jgi:ribosomal-protein-alanine N-acetyltransferase
MAIACIYNHMLEKDLDQVLAIERAVFRHPWSKDFFRLLIADMNNYMITLKLGKSVIGYGGYHLLKSKKSFLFPGREYEKLVHLINIAIAPNEQDQGYGTFLLNTLMGHARSGMGEYCYLEVRPSNERALHFYRKSGFAIIGIIENYYPQERENAFVMGKKL